MVAVRYEPVHRLSQQRGTWSLQARSRSSTMTVRSTQRMTAGAEFQATPVLSRDGKRLAYTMTRASVRLWTFPFDSANGRVTGNGQAITEGDLYVRTWSLSRDGTRLSYVAVRAGTPKAELWIGSPI
jgi:Tol biopolymer transport system component